MINPDENNTKFDLVLQIIEHPDDFSSEKLNRLLSDPELRDIYNTLCKTDSAINGTKEVDVEKEWEYFSQKYPVKRRRWFFGLSNRAASVIILTVTSLVALAIGVTVSIGKLNNHKSEVLESPNLLSETSEQFFETIALDQSDTLNEVTLEPMLFEDASLAEIMEVISKRYNVKVKFDNSELEQLRLYYKFNPALSLDEIISQLNNFEQIHITRNNSILIID